MLETLDQNPNDTTKQEIIKKLKDGQILKINKDFKNAILLVEEAKRIIDRFENIERLYLNFQTFKQDLHEKINGKGEIRLIWIKCPYCMTEYTIDPFRKKNHCPKCTSNKSTPSPPKIRRGGYKHQEDNK